MHLIAPITRGSASRRSTAIHRADMGVASFVSQERAEGHHGDLVLHAQRDDRQHRCLHGKQLAQLDRLQQEQSDCAERQAELAALTKQAAQHKETIAAQELTPVDVERMRKEHAHLEAEVGGLSTQKATLQKQAWEEEHAIDGTVNRIEGKVRDG